MFLVGDRIVYPMHGAGVIEGIEEKDILGETRRYYILRVPCGDMKIMVPVETSSDSGMRDIINEDQLSGVIDSLREESTEMSDNWNRRNRENMEKLKTGDLYNVAEVIRNLLRADKRKKLSTGEKKMLNNARQLLVSEMILVRGIGRDEAEDIINEAVGES